MKIFKISIIGLLIIGLGILMFFTFKNRFEREFEVLGCKEAYNIEKPEPGFINFSESNAKNRVAVCLCEKYMQHRDTKYKIEILKLYDEIGARYPSYEKGNKLDSICKNRKYVFLELFDL